MLVLESKDESTWLSGKISQKSHRILDDVSTTTGASTVSLKRVFSEYTQGTILVGLKAGCMCYCQSSH